MKSRIKDTSLLLAAVLLPISLAGCLVVGFAWFVACIAWFVLGYLTAWESNHGAMLGLHIAAGAVLLFMGGLTCAGLLDDD